MRRFIEDERARFAGKFGEIFRLALSRNESFERKSVGRQPRDGERRNHRRRTGDYADGDSPFMGRSDDDVTGVADSGHARVAHHDDVSVARQFCDGLGFGDLVVFVQRDHLGAGFEPQRTQQVRGRPGVLGDNDARVDQDLAQSG